MSGIHDGNGGSGGRIGIIGGTGVGQFPLDAPPEPRLIPTPWGEAAAQFGSLRGKEVIFLARHGAGHKVPPHRINYRANIAALKAAGVRAVFATTAVGSLRTLLRPGDLVLLNDILDATRERTHKTFFDGQGPNPVVHTDFTVPYSEELRAAVLAAAESLDVPLHPRGVYVCNDGPRFETPAEIRLYAQWGGDVVGMTGVPEAFLAKEAGLHYAGISLVTNPGAGLTPEPVDHTVVEQVMAEGGPRLRALITEAVARLDVNFLPPVGPMLDLPAPEV
jgi:5'-methylthioadenosine phosphorylase